MTDDEKDEYTNDTVILHKHMEQFSLRMIAYRDKYQKLFEPTEEERAENEIPDVQEILGEKIVKECQRISELFHKATDY